MKLRLLDLFWCILLFAAVTAWWTEHERMVERIEARKAAWPHLARRSRPTPSITPRHVRLNTLAYLSDDELIVSFKAVVADKGPTRYGDFDLYLWEMQRRKLSEPLEEIHRSYVMREPPVWKLPENLELLTALRRAQGKRDPLRIDISLAKDADGPSVEGTELSATLTNVDSDGADLFFDAGGDYRGGRRDKWHVKLVDERGWQVAHSNFVPFMGGGLGQMKRLKVGKSLEYPIKFDVRRYVSGPASGRYYLQAFFHSREYIARERDLTGLVVAKSELIPVTVINPGDSKPEWFPARNRPIVAILAAAALLAVVSRRFGARPSLPSGQAPTGTRPRRSLGRYISRDLIWAVLVVAAAIVYWQDLKVLDARFARLTPDAEAKWTIQLGHKPARQ